MLQTQTASAPRFAAAGFSFWKTEEAVVVAAVIVPAAAAGAVESGSQVLVGVVVALAVGGRVQEGQLVAGAALQLQDTTAQVQAALWGHTSN